MPGRDWSRGMLSSPFDFLYNTRFWVSGSPAGAVLRLYAGDWIFCFTVMLPERFGTVLAEKRKPMIENETGVFACLNV